MYFGEGVNLQPSTSTPAGKNRLIRSIVISISLCFGVSGLCFSKAAAESEFNPIDRQIGGTCHIYSAIAMFEAACFKKIGKRVHISPAFLFVQHLKERLQNKSSGQYVERKVSNNGTMIDWTLKNDAFLLAQTDGDVTGMDGGNPMTTLERLSSGQASVNSKEFPFSEPFQAKIRHIAEFYGKPEVQASNAAYNDMQAKKINNQEAVVLQETARLSARGKAYDQLRRQMPNAFDGVLKEDANIVECVDSGIEFEEIRDALTPDDVQKRVDAGQPVLCSLLMDYGKGAGAHALIIVQTTKNSLGERLFVARDSNRADPAPLKSFGGCMSAIVIK